MCYSCSRTFAHSSNLLRHERQHSGEKPHRCSFCARGFIQAVGLKRHLKKHHLEEQRQQQELENSDSEPVQPSKTISPKPFQSSEQFSLKLPMCLPPKGPIAPPSIACEEAAIHSHVTSNNSDLFRCNIDSLDSLAKSKLLNDDGSADVDAEADMFAVIAGHDTNTSSVLHDGNTSALRQRSEEAFSTDIPDNVISNIGDVYGIIFMQ
ncbi:Zinc finger C2H2-type [Trinorchestia longiramus]|nr:Zinc finger C2H2-type [Trinorchestia longiramus]